MDLRVFAFLACWLTRSYSSEENLIPGDGHWTFEIKFVPREPFRYGILRCVLVVSGRNWSATHNLKIEVNLTASCLVPLLSIAFSGIE